MVPGFAVRGRRQCVLDNRSNARRGNGASGAIGDFRRKRIAMTRLISGELVKQVSDECVRLKTS